MRWWRTAAVVAVVLVTACSGPSADGADPATDEGGGRPGSDAALPIAPPTTVAADEDRLRVASDIVNDLQATLDLPEALASCVSHRAAVDPDAMEALRHASPDEPDTMNEPRTLISECRQRVEAAPRFALELQRSAGGALGPEQIECAVETYADLDADDLAAIAAATLNPGAVDRTDNGVLEELMTSCGIAGT